MVNKTKWWWRDCVVSDTDMIKHCICLVLGTVTEAPLWLAWSLAGRASFANIDLFINWWFYGWYSIRFGVVEISWSSKASLTTFRKPQATGDVDLDSSNYIGNSTSDCWPAIQPTIYFIIIIGRDLLVSIVCRVIQACLLCSYGFVFW